MFWNYQIFKFTSKDMDGCEMAEQRLGAPLYGLFEVYKNEDGSIWGRTQKPELIWDSYLDDETDPVKAFSNMLDMMKSDLQHPIIDDETFVFADPEGVKTGLCELCEIVLETGEGLFCAGCEAMIESQVAKEKDGE